MSDSDVEEVEGAGASVKLTAEGLPENPKLTKKIASAKASLTSSRGWITRRVRACAKLEEHIERDGTLLTKNLEDRVESVSVDLGEAGDSYTKKFNALMDLFAGAEQTKAVKEEMAEFEAAASTTFDVLSDALNALGDTFMGLQQRELERRNAASDERRTFAAVAAEVDGAVGGGRGKPNEALKPKVLQISDTPRFLAQWVPQIRAYFESSRFERESLEVQRIYFIALISEALWIRIEPYLTKEMPIVAEEGRECALTILEREFLQIYPIFVRRLEFFSYRQDNGQTWSDFSANLESIGNQAQLEGIGPDELYVLRILTSITDDELKKEFLKVDVADRTHTALKELGMRLETARATKKRLSKQTGSSAQQAHGGAKPKTQGSASANNTNKNKGKKNDKGGGPPQGQKPGGQQQQQQQSSTRKRCEKCGFRVKKDEMAEHKKKCPCGDTGICSICKGKGHWAPVCPKKKSGDQK